MTVTVDGIPVIFSKYAKKGTVVLLPPALCGRPVLLTDVPKTIDEMIAHFRHLQDRDFLRKCGIIFDLASSPSTQSRTATPNGDLEEPSQSDPGQPDRS